MVALTGGGAAVPYAGAAAGDPAELMDAWNCHASGQASRAPPRCLVNSSGVTRPIIVQWQRASGPVNEKVGYGPWQKWARGASQQCAASCVHVQHAVGVQPDLVVHPCGSPFDVRRHYAGAGLPLHLYFCAEQVGTRFKPFAPDALSGAFDLTATQLRSSDLRVLGLRRNATVAVDEAFGVRPYLIAAVVSNVHTVTWERTRFLHELEDVLGDTAFHVYGRAAVRPGRTPRSWPPEYAGAATPMGEARSAGVANVNLTSLYRLYKFVIAFENELEEDYISGACANLRRSHAADSRVHPAPP